MHQLVHQLRTQDIEIPPYPAVALALQRLNGPRRTSIADIAKLVASDAALAASTLRLAAAVTSAAPATLPAAIQKIGVQGLHRHVLAVNFGARATSRATSHGPLAELRRDEWRRALIASALAAELAPLRALSADAASLAALLHDFGAMVVVAALEQLVTTLPTLPLASWRAAVDELHVEIGTVVARRWNLAEPIIAVIAHHHAPALAPLEFRPMTTLIATIDRVVDVLDAHPVEGVGALSTLEGLLPGELERIVAVFPRIARMLDAFERPRAADAPASPPASPRPHGLEDGWPASFEVVTRSGQALSAVALAPGALAFRSPTAMPTSWLAELTLHIPPDSVTLLANVTSCDALEDGRFLIVARPFALDGAEKSIWLRLLARTRPPRTKTA